MHCVAGKQLAVRPVLDTERPNTHGWSLGASDGDHNIRLDAMDEGLTRLVASLPTDEAESKGETWSALPLLVASKARLLSLVASLPCLLFCSKSATGSHVSSQNSGVTCLQPMHDTLCRLSSAYAVSTNSQMCGWCVS